MSIPHGEDENDNSFHIWKLKKQMMNCHFQKAFAFVLDALKEELHPLETSRPALERRFPIQPFNSPGLTWASFALRSSLFFRVLGRELVLFYFFLACYLLSFLFCFLSFLLIVSFDDLCILRCEMLLGMPIAIQMPGGKTFCRELLKLLLKSF